MRAGRMDKRITIQQVTETQDGYGDPADSWAAYKTVWAEVLEKRGREYFNNPETVAAAPAVFRIRYLAGVTRKMRISYDSETYDIESIAMIGRKEGLEIIATAIAD